MLEVNTLGAYRKHIGGPSPMYDDFDVRRIDSAIVYKKEYEPIRHRIYAISLHIDLETGGKPLLYFKIPYQVVAADQKKPLCKMGYCIAFTESFLEKYRGLASLMFDVPFLRLENTIPLELEYSDVALLQSIYEQMCEEHNSDHSDRFDMIVSYMQTLMLQIRRIYTRSAMFIKEVVQSGNQNDIAIAGQFKFMLDTFFKESENNQASRTVAHYASRLSVHPNYLNAVVKRVTGKTAHELLQENLIRFAKDMLLQTNLSVKEISYQLSFNAPSHFVTFFKKNTSYTPARFRQLSQRNVA
ncbi:MAG TPA: helix-turn-helix domain-containing protein [Ohtaekwangia sp.]|uniref:helix-turn-helix domain-containing protein n=1 Tax=Ohtaekwangia sp. TaxID=2066019 RepID=UPI002F940D12